ncbi:MAG: TPM domain-containing protein [Bacteroidota bacterium]|nr:TPM domain-containing protein [Bacteroidota bacterium]
MKLRHRIVPLAWSAVLAVSGVGVTAARAQEVPFLAGRVVDEAHLLSPTAVEEFERTLKAYEDSTGNQFVVLTIASLENGSLEEYAHRVAETWKLGKKGVDNGALLLVVRESRKIRIEVGYGLEASLTDAVCSFIISEKITPRFRAGDYDGGVRDGILAMIAAADGTLDTSRGSEWNGMPMASLVVFLVFWYGFLLVFTFAAVLTPGAMGWFLYVFLTPFWGLPVLMLASASLTTPLVLLGAYLLLIPLLRLLLPSTSFGKKILQARISAAGGGKRSWFWSTGWVGGSSESSWSGGGSSFSGGGGSFGGGGASGGW